ncbi:tetratricopeptide repeat protein [Sphingomonas sp. CJ99]
MRLTAITTAAALSVLCIATSLTAQRPDDQVDAKSVALLEQSRAAQTAGNLDTAVDLAETALVVDPRNRAAYVLLGDLAKAREMPGKALGFYREALKLEPNDLSALRGQGQALVAKGAINRARESLAKIQAICAKQCAEATTLASTIQQGPPAIQTAVKSDPPVTVIPDKAPEANP